MILIEQYLVSDCVHYHQRSSHSLFRDVTLAYLFDTLDEALTPALAQETGVRT